MSLFNKIMCEICNDYAAEYDIRFNPSKCKLINYSKNDSAKVSMYFDGVLIESEDSANHIGHNIGYKDDKDNLKTITMKNTFQSSHRRT